MITWRRGFLLIPIIVWIGGGGVASLRADDWIELRTPHFNVMSEASESRTKSWATEFELFRRAMTTVLPVDSGAVEPVTLVLFRSDRRLRPFKPMEGGKPSNVSGFFAKMPGRNYIAIAIEGARDDVRESVFHEAVHWHLRASDRALPLWMEEGLGELFGNFRLSGNSFIVGSTRPEYLHYVGVAKPMPFAKMAEFDDIGLNFNGKHADLTRLFYCQSWVLVHALFFGTEGVGHHALTVFTSTPPTHEDLTKDIENALAVSATTFDKRIADYLHHGKFRPLTIPFDRKDVEAGFSFRQPSAAEVDLTLGNLLVVAGRPADAEPYLRRARVGLPDQAGPMEALAITDLWLGRLTEACDRYRELFRRGEVSYFGHYVLAQAELDEVFAAWDAHRRPDTQKPVEHLIAALQLNRRFVLGYETLGMLAAFARDRGEEAEKLVAEGARRYPANGRIQLGVAVQKIRKGDLEAAREVVLRARASITPADKISAAMLEHVEAMLEIARMAKRGSFMAPSNNRFSFGPDASGQTPQFQALAPQSASARIEEARRLYSEGKWAEAEKVLNQVAADPMAAARQGEIATLRRDTAWQSALTEIERLGAEQKDEAVQRLRQILAENPSDKVRERAETLLARTVEAK